MYNQRRRNFRRTTLIKQAYMYRYNYSFNGYCYTNNHFGHKAIDCRRNTDIVCYKCNNIGNIQRNYKMNGRYDPAWKHNINDQGMSKRYYQSFDYDCNIICYSCNSLGHKAHSCRKASHDLKKLKRKEGIKVWRKKEPVKVWKQKQSHEKTNPKIVHLAQVTSSVE